MHLLLDGGPVAEELDQSAFLVISRRGLSALVLVQAAAQLAKGLAHRLEACGSVGLSGGNPIGQLQQGLGDVFEVGLLGGPHRRPGGRGAVFHRERFWSG